MAQIALGVLPAIVAMYVLYWVIRLGVRHALRDVENVKHLAR
jgi:hypothetical protein